MATISTIINPKWKILLLIWFWTLSANLINQVAGQSHNCSHVKCPPMSEISCPEDSYIREVKEESNVLSISDNYEIIEEIFVHCCVTQKCSCRVCHIPSCHNTSLVLMETIPETETPGKCCGQYDCIYEPNCTEIINSNGLHWLTDCQRCECISGERVCHRSCDEKLITPRNCISTSLNRFFSNGDTWKEGPCTTCECQNGKNNCLINFCKPINCKNPIKKPDECCPICIEDNINNNISDIIIVTTDPTTNLTNLLPNIENDCISTHLNRFFSNGDTWQEEPCKTCECHNGKNNCQISFCKPIDCKKRITKPNECCPVCIEDDIDDISDVIILTTDPTPTTITTNLTNLLPIIENDSQEQTTEQIPDIIIQQPVTTTNILTTTTTTETSTSTTTDKPNNLESISNDKETYNQIDEIHILITEPPPPPPLLAKKPILTKESTTQIYYMPCTTKEPPVPCTCPDNTDTFQMIQQPEQQLFPYYVFIAISTISAVLFAVLYLKEKSKKRSYDPVPSTDDNFNKIATKIKAIEIP